MQALTRNKTDSNEKVLATANPRLIGGEVISDGLDSKRTKPPDTMHGHEVEKLNKGTRDLITTTAIDGVIDIVPIAYALGFV